MKSTKKANDALSQSSDETIPVDKRVVTQSDTLAPRRFVIANWKMNKTIQESVDYIKELIPLLPHLPAGVNVWLSVPFTAFSSVKQTIGSADIMFGAQNMNDASAGSFTGEIAASMLTDAGCSFVILGHSERRRFFNETDEFIQKKVERAIESGLIPVLCIGETLEERESGQTESVLERQMRVATQNLQSEAIEKIIFAYEPVWAIGTGKTATSEIVEKSCAFIQSVYSSLIHDDNVSAAIVYGGSVTEKNAKDLSSIPHVSGFLVGTASLQPANFAKIVSAYT